MSALLGDFLALASEHIEEATGDDVPVLPEAARPMVRELGSLTAVMARCADAFVWYDDTDALDLLDARARAVLEARSALRHAAARMREAVGAAGEGGDGHANLAAKRLSDAAACLSAGHDLLQAHFAPGRFGSRLGNSPWAPVIVSAPVNAALVAEMAGHAWRLARWALPLSGGPVAGNHLPVQTRVALGAACASPRPLPGRRTISRAW